MEDENRANVESEEIASEETNLLEAVPSGLLFLLTKESLVGELHTPVPNVAYHALVQGLEGMRDVPVNENCRNDEFQQAKEERDSFLVEVNAYKMVEKKLAK